MQKQSGTSLKKDFGSSPPINDLEAHLAESIKAQVDSLSGKLKCLVICLSHAWGGLEQVAVQDSLDLAGLGLSVQVLCLKDSPVHLHLLNHEEKSLNLISLSSLPKNYFDFAVRAELHRLGREGINLIHTHQTSLLGSIVPALWSRSRVALVATRHIMNNHNKKDFFHRALYARLDCLMVVSQAVRKNILDTHPLRSSRVKVVRLGLDFTLFDPARISAQEILKQREAWGAGPETLVIGLVGRIDPAKGQATFIKAAGGLLRGAESHWALHSANFAKSVKFVIIGEETAGSDPKHLQELKEIVLQFRLGDLIVFAGYQKNIPLVMKSLDIFTMPSRQEAFGLVAIEAMAMGCPVIISRGGSAEEIVGDRGAFGLLTRPDDAFDLQRQIRYLMEHPQERLEMGQRAREHVKFNYDRRKRILGTLTLYQRALRRRQGSL